MTTSTFDQAKHPRGHIGNAGGFSTKQHSAPVDQLVAPAADELAETVAYFDDQIADQPNLTREEWLDIKGRAQVHEKRLFTRDLKAASTPNGGVYVDGQSQTVDDIFNRQQARDLAYALDYKTRFTDKDAEAAKRAHHARLAQIARDRKLLVWDEAVSAGTMEPAMRTALSSASDSTSTTADLAELAKIDHDWVVDEIVGNPSTSTETLVGLSRRTPIAARNAARRADCPSAHLVEASTSEHHKIREAVAIHANTPAKTLRAMAKDDDRDVRNALAYNPNTPKSALKTLFDGQGSEASTQAHRRLKALDAGN